MLHKEIKNNILFIYYLFYVFIVKKLCCKYKCETKLFMVAVCVAQWSKKGW